MAIYFQPVRTTGSARRAASSDWQNFRDVLGNEIFRQAVQNSFVFAGIAVALKTVLGIWLAMLLFRPLRFKRLVRAAVLLPWVIPTALSTLAWGWMFDSLYSVVTGRRSTSGS